MNRPKTVFIDIDGTLLFHHGDAIAQLAEYPELLEGVREKLITWDRKCYNIILTTGRRESTRHVTEVQLQNCGIIYDQLIMGIGGGERVVINDLKPGSNEPTASAYCIERNAGLGAINI